MKNRDEERRVLERDALYTRDFIQCATLAAQRHIERLGDARQHGLKCVELTGDVHEQEAIGGDAGEVERDGLAGDQVRWNRVAGEGIDEQ